VLDLGGVLESGVDDGPGQLRLEQEVLEAGRVDRDVVPLLGVLRVPRGGAAGGVLRDLGDFLLLLTGGVRRKWFQDGMSFSISSSSRDGYYKADTDG